MKEQRKSSQNCMLLCLCALMFCTSSAWADFRFGEPVNLGAPINTPLGEGTPMISQDGLSLYYVSGSSANADIWVSKRKSTKDAWEPGTSLGPIVNSSVTESHPFVSADELTLYFSKSFSIWQTTRPTVDDDWTPPVVLGAPINSSEDDIHTCISANGLEFYFASSRHRPKVDWDLYVCKRESVQDAWGEPTALGVLNSNSYDYSPSLSSDGLTMFFNSHRAGGLDEADIYMTTRSSLDASWSPPVNIGPPVNTPYNEYAPHISSDGRTLYFGDNPWYTLRPGGMGGGDIWTTSIDPIVDFNGDGIIDAADMCIMVDHWGEDYSLCNIGPMPWGDGVVDVQDLIVLSEHLFKNVNDPTLIAHWAFDETEGINAYDSVSGNDDFVMGGAVWQPDDGKVNGAIELDGVDDCIIPGSIGPNPTEGMFSIVAWIKGGAPGQVIIAQPAVADFLAVDSEGNLMTGLNRSDQSSEPLLSQASVTDGQWHRIGLVWDGSRRVLFVDSVKVAEDTEDGQGVFGSGLYIGVGKDYMAGTFFSGLIDDVRIYNRAVKP